MNPHNINHLLTLTAASENMPSPGVESRLLATIATQATMLADYRAFYQYMVSNDYQNDLMDLLKDDMSAVSIHGDEYQLVVSVWAEYDALLMALKEHEAELKGKEETE